MGHCLTQKTKEDLQIEVTYVVFTLEGTHAWSQASLAPHERLPELPVIPREKTHTGAAARENPPSSRDCGLLFLPDLESNPWSFLQTSQEALLSLGHSMGSKRYLSRLERRAEYFVSPRDEALPRVSLDATPRSLLPLERNIMSWTKA